MAPNGTTSRKTPAAGKPGKREGSAPPDGLFDDMLNDGSPKVKDEVRRALPGTKKAGNWDVEVHGGAPKSKDASARSTPTLNKVPSSVAKAFPTAKPMADKPEILKCTHCKRAVSKHVMPRHIEACLNKKQEKQRKKKEAKDARDAAARKERNGAESEDEEEGEGGKNTAGKKRKAGDDGEDGGPGGGPAKKKKKKDDKTKAPRPKAPVDVEKQCGVELPNGGQCARSLTCKSHSMGAKRAVPGRSAPYDKLLMDYQRKNQAKLQKAQFDASAPNPEDENLPSGPVDSEEERDAVMSSIARNFGGAPLYQRVQVPLRGRYNNHRIKGMLQSALGGRSGGGLFGNGNGNGGGGFFGSRDNAPQVDEQGIVHARRGSVVPGARSMMAPVASRKASVQAG